MKWILIVSLLIFSSSARSQDSLHVARLKTLQGKIAPFSALVKNDSLILICFWSVSSEESIAELNSINAELGKWQETRPFKFMAVSIDDSKLSSRMRPLYNMNGWTFDSYVDIYGDLRRALHSNNVPQSMIIYKNEVVYEQSGWSVGTENYLFQRLQTLKR